mmetsp:Transcript_25108/g.62220  ORF Transcript_25108/g.62220 Transcript_25108/m.62220 type:complete len:120 (+) Transcript_25108:46-405(+)
MQAARSERKILTSLERIRYERQPLTQESSSYEWRFTLHGVGVTVGVAARVVLTYIDTTQTACIRSPDRPHRQRLASGGIGMLLTSTQDTAPHKSCAETPRARALGAHVAPAPRGSSSSS